LTGEGGSEVFRAVILFVRWRLDES
jgi:hypothetical protein